MCATAQSGNALAVHTALSTSELPCVVHLTRDTSIKRTTMLRRLAWFSVRSPAFSVRHIDQIIACSGLNNVRDHVSGMLLFTGTHFLSMLEGDEADLRNLWRRLEGDPRHCNPVRIGDDPCGNRLYPAWGSAYIADSEVDGQIQSLRSFQEQGNMDRARACVRAGSRPSETRTSPRWTQIVHPILLRGHELVASGRDRFHCEPSAMSDHATTKARMDEHMHQLDVRSPKSGNQ